MFDSLKKKFSEAIKGFVGRERKEAEVAEAPKEGSRGNAAVPEQEAKAVEAEERAAPEKHAAPPNPAGGAAQKKRDAGARPERLVDLSIASRIKKTIIGSVALSDSEIEGLLSKLKISMLESDVTFDVAEEFAEDLRGKLHGRRIASRDIDKEVLGSVRLALLDILRKGSPGFDLLQRARSKTDGPFVILFLGPNGAGKTTLIAKLASRMKREEVSAVISASDTFRAAAIEQMEHHAARIGVPIIKSSYGADPASVAFDAIAYARAHRAAVVLIDSAGRQETNKSLIREMEKMARVSKPDMTLFVGESTAGNAIASQIVEFGKHMRIDGIILTKLDCDAKGGSALSISKLTGIPILFFGVGEGYDALVPYDPEFVADAILPSAG
jgi:fused signal recognition particle receptor